MPPRKTANIRSHDIKKTCSQRGRLDDGSANPIDVHVGWRVLLRRTQLGMSQEMLADALGLSVHQIRYYERGVNRISSSRLYEISRIMSVSIDFFFDDVPEMALSKSPAKIANRETTVASRKTDPMFKQETVNLVEAYYRITDSSLRDLLLGLTKSLWKAG